MHLRLTSACLAQNGMNMPRYPHASDLVRSDIFLKAVERGDRVLLDNLVRLGAQSGYLVQDSHDGTTLLHLAAGAESCPKRFVEQLLDSGANPNAVTCDGVTALHIAAACGNEDCLVELLKRGGDPGLRDDLRNDVFDLLFDNEHLELLQKVRSYLGIPVTPESSLVGEQVIDRQVNGVPAGSNSRDSWTGDVTNVSSDTESILNTAYVFPHPYLSPAYLGHRRRRPRPNILDGHDLTDSLVTLPPETSASSTASSNVSPALLRLSNQEIREQLLSDVGEDVGPVLPSNRSLHLHTLAHVKMGRAARIKLCESPDLFDASRSSFDTGGVDCCEVVHTDFDNRLALKERHYQSSDSDSRSAPPTIVPPELLELTNEGISERLKQMGESPGPVTDGTRSVYLKHLVRLTPSRASPTTYRDALPPDVHFLVSNVDRMGTYEALEAEMVRSFETPNPRLPWREGNHKTSFNYLLLDSRVSRNLPARAGTMTTLAEQMADFVKSVFYVGKGKRARPFSHLNGALMERARPSSASPSLKPCDDKTKRILQIWKSGEGVVSLHIFQNVLAVEAYTREACMIEALTLRRLTNQRKGEFYGVVGGWPEKKRKKLGAFLLLKAFNILLSEGERRLGPLDL